MRYIKTQKTYKASNVTLKIDREAGIIEAYSYNWWQFIAVINGKVVFNEYPYSVSTRGHQSKVKKILAREGVLVDHFVSTRESLSSTSLWRLNAIRLLEDKILDLLYLTRCKGTRKVKNEERKAEIEKLKAKIEEIGSI
jgi:hypothetical protein